MQQLDGKNLQPEQFLDVFECCDVPALTKMD